MRHRLAKYHVFFAVALDRERSEALPNSVLREPCVSLPELA